jgi:hypothetical protein
MTENIVIIIIHINIIIIIIMIVDQQCYTKLYCLPRNLCIYLNADQYQRLVEHMLIF